MTRSHQWAKLWERAIKRFAWKTVGALLDAQAEPYDPDLLILRAHQYARWAAAAQRRGRAAAARALHDYVDVDALPEAVPDQEKTR